MHGRSDLDQAVPDRLKAATAADEEHLHWSDTPLLLGGTGEGVAHVRKQPYMHRKPPR